MLYCPRCNNTHWKALRPKNFSRRLLIFTLRRDYQCLKCDKVLLASLFHDEDWFRSLFQLSPGKSNSTYPEPVCPECGQTTHRARRKGLERIFFFGRAYRCSDCEYRFIRFR
jgi:hypothetical protein